MKRIKLVTWNGHNFGDDLSPYLISKLSGVPLNKIVTKLTDEGSGYLRNKFKEIIKCALRGGILTTQPLFPFEENIIAIGSILDKGNAKSKIWGAGFKNKGQRFRGGFVYAVRGPHSDQMLQDQGFGLCEVYGDPALLLPLVYKSDARQVHEVGLIPHWTEAAYFMERFSASHEVITLRTQDITSVEKIIDKIVSCKRILSTSLHGIIVAHAYGIPALWIKHEGMGDSDGIKYADYFDSVGIQEYDPIEDFDEFLAAGNIEKIFDTYKDRSLPAKDLATIRKSLLSVAPFPLLDKFRNI